jgi:hypothetical protein
MGARQVMREMRRGAALMHPAEEQGSHQLSTSAGAAGAGAAGWERALITPIEADFFQRHTHYVEIMVPHADTGEISCAWCLRGCVIGVPAVLPMMIASHRVVWGGGHRPDARSPVVQTCRWLPARHCARLRRHPAAPDTPRPWPRPTTTTTTTTKMCAHQPRRPALQQLSLTLADGHRAG